jgi:hypothetical protein
VRAVLRGGWQTADERLQGLDNVSRQAARWFGNSLRDWSLDCLEINITG